VKKIRGYREIAEDLERHFGGIDGMDERKARELRRLIKLKLVDIAGQTISDTSAAARLACIADIFRSDWLKAARSRCVGSCLMRGFKLKDLQSIIVESERSSNE